MNTFKRNATWLLPLILLALITPFSAELDLFIAKMTFYRGWSQSAPVEYGFYTTPFFDFIYLYGGMPAAFIGVLAGLCIAASCCNSKLKQYRGICSVLCLTLFFGSFIITQSILKEFWGRPRPRQIEDFGGTQSFRAYYEPQFSETPEPSKSFPSGHSTCGFYFFCFYFLGRRYKMRALALMGLLTGIGLGGVLSVARIVQGGHFMSDAYVAALIMWLTAYFVDYLVFDAPLFNKLRQQFLGHTHSFIKTA